jgi:hypothetical protein
VVAAETPPLLGKQKVVPGAFARTG